MRAWLATDAPAAAATATASNLLHPQAGDIFEYVLGGVGLVVLVAACCHRRRWLKRLAPPWPGTPVDLLVFVTLLCAMVFLCIYILVGGILRLAPHGGATTQLFVGILSMEGAFFGAIGLYHFGYRKLSLNAAAPLASGAPPPISAAGAEGGNSADADPSPAPVSRCGSYVSRAARFGPLVFLAVMPVVLALSIVWDWLLDALGHPVSEQAIVDQFRAIDTWPGRAIFVVFAAVLAPVTEEIIFRGVIYRGVAKIAPRWLAVLISATLFGAAHTDWSTFVPLAALGAIFALAYDATGCIWVTMVAHSLFNLNTIAAILLGLGS